ncbi:C4-type zinc ribbon domain-containing protein [Pseudonocardia sp. DR1-2]|uniref:zinc ribbon domain-containing protein n=1 Tax=Pseudonocardia sp. DR1-2 TaxID=2951168 RepID=UPI00204366B4|nr:C4-type zinc ribbon domain-containing protein [Pseudonocardia sp. DR1-2]MCM3848755.1 C4-type zinc ribbon domain-containing protein [Pseudonocardia sp. DR1-2]
MKADPTAQAKLVTLAEVDAEIGRLTHRRSTLPELAQLDEAEQRVRAARDALVRAETRAGDLDRDIARLERDIDGVRARTERDHTLLAGSGISAKQATELQHELDTLARRQGVLEDEQLGIMEEREAVGIELDHARGELSEAETAVGEVTAKRESAEGDIDATRAGRDRARTEVVAALPADLLADYERIRAGGRVAAGQLRESRCGACRLELDRTFLGQVRTAAADEVVHCEECGAILVRGK